MYQSLLKHCSDFHLYVVAFDDLTYEYFQKNPYKNLTAISLSQFEDEKLLSIKSTRTPGEYCWTSTPSTVMYCINTFKLGHCVYIDADLRFYSDPKSLFEEWGSKSVLITEHRCTPEYDESALNGIYCVQFVGFKNDADGMKALNYWRDACIDWCYARYEDGKFGDQKYLDDWTTRFNNVHVLQHLGGGIAPWNMQQYDFYQDADKIVGVEKSTRKKFEAVFFHFHGTKIFLDDCAMVTNEIYKINKDTYSIFFKPYVLDLVNLSREIHKNTNKVFNSNGANQKSPERPTNYLSLLRWYLFDVRQSINNINGKLTLSRYKPLHYLKF